MVKLATYAEKIIKLEEKAAKYGGKVEQWERFGNNVQNLSNTLDKINHSVDIPAKLPVRVLTVTVGHLDSGEKRAEWQKMSTSEYHDFYRGRHGLLNKIDAHINYANESKVHSAVRKTILNLENSVVNGAEVGLGAFKRGIIDPTADFAQRKFREGIYESSDLGTRAGVMISENSARAAKWTINHAREMSKYKQNTPRNATLKSLYEHKIIKYNRKSELTEARLNYARNGLSGGESKFKRKQKRAAWKTISGNDKFEFKSKASSRAEKKMHSAQRKLYQTRIVKTYEYNELTGKTRVRFREAVDTSKPREFKRKRPDGVFKSLGKAGAAAAANKAFNQMAQSDDTSVQALGKLSSSAFSQVSRLNAQRKARRENKFYQQRHKAKMSYEKANAKLQVRNSKSDAKRAQKKALRKKRNQKSFKAAQKKAAKKAAGQAAAKKTLASVTKSKYALIVAAVVIVVILPFVMFMGGSSSASLSSVIPVEDDLIAFADSYFDNKLASVLSDKEREIRDNNDDVNSITKVFPSDAISGHKTGTIPAYLSAKYGGEWTKEQAMSAIDALIAECYPVKVEKEEADSDDDDSSLSKYDYTLTLTCEKSVNDYINETLDKDQMEDFNDLMDEGGGHQVLGPFSADKDQVVSDNTEDYYTFPTSSLPEHCTHISGEINVIASERGTISSVSDGKLVIFYGTENFTVTYYSDDISELDFTVGKQIEKGDSLFKASDGMYLSTYNNEYDCYINPYYIFSTKDDDGSEESEDNDEENDNDD